MCYEIVVIISAPAQAVTVEPHYLQNSIYSLLNYNFMKIVKEVLIAPGSILQTTGWMMGSLRRLFKVQCFIVCILAFVRSGPGENWDLLGCRTWGEIVVLAFLPHKPKTVDWECRQMRPEAESSSLKTSCGIITVDAWNG